MAEPHATPASVRWLRNAESVVLVLVAAVLVVLAVLLLGNSVVEMVHAVASSELGKSGIEILGNVLLVMMVMEIVYTVTVSIESHALTAEPFLAIGIIAAIRRMLLITAESTKVVNEPALFRSLLLELALLSFIVIAMSASAYILSRCRGAAKEAPAPPAAHDTTAD